METNIVILILYYIINIKGLSSSRTQILDFIIQYL